MMQKQTFLGVSLQPNFCKLIKNWTRKEASAVVGHQFMELLDYYLLITVLLRGLLSSDWDWDWAWAWDRGLGMRMGNGNGKMGMGK